MEALRSFLRDNGRIHFEGGRVMTPINDNPTRAMRVVRCDETMAAVLRGKRFLVFDGAMGTMLQQAGLEAGGLSGAFEREGGGGGKGGGVGGWPVI